MTTKRVFVASALHTELTEHVNLVRALRTARTLDLTAHLIRHSNDDDDDDDEAWTLWPLIDCPVPEWTLADEIQHLAGVDTAENHIVFHTASVLVHILNLLADQRPSAPGCMQNRLHPMNWQDVISLLAVSALVHPRIVARAEKRLERIYGPSSTNAIQRLELVTAEKSRFSKLASIHEDQLFAPPILHPRPCRKDPKATSRRLAGRVKTLATIDTDVDSDA